MNKFDCTKATVLKSISSLSKFGYIDLELNNSGTNNSKRIINRSFKEKNNKYSRK